ncbi:MAG: hypothetical protein IPJ19_10940 [Planctomycetes bacterium]|nr:hypothetical protein [Planctomycetota bacterium]
MLCALLLLALVEEPSAAPIAALRRECFVIEDSTPGAASDPVGWAEFLRREDHGGMLLECEYVFVRPGRGERWRVRHVEKLTDNGPQLVWREIGTAAGRTLTLERTREGDQWRCQAFERDESVRSTLDTGAGAVFPLYLIELARNGQLGAAELTLFDPLESALVSRHATTVYAPASGEHTRTLELHRPDATLAGRYVFAGSELRSFQWQEGGWVARRIDPEQYSAAVGGAVELSGARARAPACSDSAK